MQNGTVLRKWLGLLLATVCLAGTAYGQQETRQVTLTLNMATVADTTQTSDFIEVRGAVNGVSPITLADGNVIDWSDASTLEPVNIGGDYWQITFEIADTTDLTFKFYSQQTEDANLNGWEADPNPNIPPGVNDTTLTVHFFEAQTDYHGVSGDRGDYDWRPYASKEDSVAVWFRVAMFGPESEVDSYDPAAEAPAQQIGVRGDNMDINGDASVTGPVDWGITKVVLQRETTTQTVAGYNIYSGVAYYPMDLVGQTQAYKFVIDNDDLTDGTLQWEEANVPADNRRFVVPAQDTTLHWVYYGNTPPVAQERVQAPVIFAVDLSPLQAIGLFDLARGDTLEVRGSFNGWDCSGEGAPDDCVLGQVPGTNEFENVIAIDNFAGTELNYKYFLNLNNEAFRDDFGIDVIPDGWEEPITTQGGNRTFMFEGDPNTPQVLPLKRFNDVLPGNIIPDGTSIDINFSVDMTPALTLDTADPFVPGTDSVTIFLSEPFWAITQGYMLQPRDDDPNVGNSVDRNAFLRNNFMLTDDDGDMVYTGTLTVTGPTYGAIQFQYTFGSNGTYTEEQGAGLGGGSGRRRVVFIPPNADGSWPASHDAGAHTYQQEGALPFDTNPLATGIEVVDNEVPARVWLGENYPNPFNPTTTFEYALDRTQKVRVRVYDMLGRVVATLVDGVQPASTYQVQFDASQLASGVYIYRLEAASQVITKRMLLIK